MRMQMLMVQKIRITIRRFITSLLLSRARMQNQIWNILKRRIVQISLNSLMIINYIKRNFEDSGGLWKEWGKGDEDEESDRRQRRRK